MPRLIELVDARRVPSTPMMTIYVDPKVKGDAEAVQRIALRIEVTNVPDVATVGTIVEELKVVVAPQPALMRARGVTRDELEQALRDGLDVRLFEMRSGSGSGEGRTLEIRAKETVSGAAKTKKEEAIEEMPFKQLLLASESAKSVRIKGVPGIKRALIKKESEEYVIYTEGSNLDGVLS
ncbi:DNA-directed RNA polymerase subunit A', partial [mine drainage metagenome]